MPVFNENGQWWSVFLWHTPPPTHPTPAMFLEETPGFYSALYVLCSCDKEKFVKAQAASPGYGSSSATMQLYDGGDNGGAGDGGSGGKGSNGVGDGGKGGDHGGESFSSTTGVVMGMNLPRIL